MKHSLIDQLRKWALLFCLLSGSACIAQSNDVFSFFTKPSTPLTGSRVASVTVSPIWVLGSPPRQFGIVECSYWTDSAEHAIPWAANKARQPGDKHHSYTRLLLGGVTLSFPLPPIMVAVLAGAVILTFGFIASTRFRRARTQANDESINNINRDSRTSL